MPRRPARARAVFGSSPVTSTARRTPFSRKRATTCPHSGRIMFSKASTPSTRCPPGHVEHGVAALSQGGNLAGHRAHCDRVAIHEFAVAHQHLAAGKLGRALPMPRKYSHTVWGMGWISRRMASDLMAWARG